MPHWAVDGVGKRSGTAAWGIANRRSETRSQENAFPRARDRLGGGIGAYAFMTYAAPALTATGNTVGWPRGHIKISAVIYAPDATVAWSRTNDCWTATSCTLPTYASCPIKAGYRQMYVDAWSVDYPNLPMKHGSAEALVIL